MHPSHTNIPETILRDFNKLTTPISDVIGHDGLEAVLDTLFKISKGNFPYFLKLIENITPPVQKLFERGQKEMVVNVFGIAGKLADIHPGPATALLNKSPEIIDLINIEALEHISDISGKIALVSWDSASRFIVKSPFRIEAILQKTDPKVFYQIQNLSKSIADTKWQAALNVFENAPAILDRLLAVGDKSLPEEIYTLANQTAQKYPQTAVSLIQNSPNIIEKIGDQTFKIIFDSILLVAAVNETSSVKLLDKSAETIDHLLKQGDGKLVISVYDLVSQTAEASDTIAVQLFEKSAEWIDIHGFEILEKTAGLCCKIGNSSRRAASVFMETGPELVKRIGIEGLEKSAALFFELGNVCDRTAEQLCRNSPDIIDSVSYEGLEDIANFCAYLSKDGPGLTQGVIQNHSIWLNRLLTNTDRKHIRNIYRLLSTMAEKNPRIAIAMMENIPDLLARITVAQLEELSSLVLQTAQQSWTIAASLIKIAPAIIDLIGYKSLGKMADLGKILSRKNVYSAVSTLEKVPQAIDNLVKSTDALTGIEIFDLISDIASIDTDAFGSFLDKSPTLLKQTGRSGLKRITTLSLDITQKHPDVAAQWIKTSPDIIDLLDLNGLEMLTDYYKKIAGHDSKTAIHLLRGTPDIIARLLQSIDKNAVFNVYELFNHIARDNWEISAALFEKSPDYVKASGYEGLDMIARQAMILAGINTEKAVTFAKGESIEFSDFMENLPQGIRLNDVKPVLSNYLMALMGRRIDIDEGKKANTDGRKITLPKRVREFQEDDQNFIYYKVMATHLEAHLEYGSFEFEITEIQHLVQTVKEKYGMNDSSRGSDLERFYQYFPEQQLIKDLIHIAEDYRVETRLKKEYPVLGEHIMMVHKHNIRKKPSIQKIKNKKQKSIEIIRQELLAENPVKDLSREELSILRTARAEARLLDSPEASVQDAVRAAANIYLVIHQSFKDAYQPVNKETEPLNQSQVQKNIGSFGKTSKQIFEQLNAGQSENKSQSEEERSQEKTEPSSGASPSRTVPDTDNPMEVSPQKTMSRRSIESEDPEGHQGYDNGKENYEKQNTPSRSMKFSSTARVEKLLKDLFKEKGITPAEIEKKTKHMMAEQLELFLNRLESTIPIKEELEKEKGTRIYPEWGNDISGYRNNWARIREQKMAGTSNDFYMETLQQHAGLLKKIRREFQMMRPEESAKVKKQYDGEDIDLDAAVEYAIDHKIGLSPSEKNYQRIVKNRRDVATLLLIDMSKSTKGATIHCEKQALVIMSEALKEVGDAFAIYGFSGDNRDNVDFYKIKGFEEAYGQDIMKRISAIDHRFENRDGTALRHAVNIMKRREEKTKLIILLSDGKPVDKEYSGNYAIEDTRMALIETRKNGIHTFCVTVDKNAAQYLPRMYSHSNWAVINDVNKLPEKMYGIYSRLTH